MMGVISMMNRMHVNTYQDGKIMRMWSMMMIGMTGMIWWWYFDDDDFEKRRGKLGTLQNRCWVIFSTNAGSGFWDQWKLYNFCLKNCFFTFDISEDGYYCLKRSENCKKIFETLQKRCCVTFSTIAGSGFSDQCKQYIFFENCFLTFDKSEDGYYCLKLSENCTNILKLLL